MAEMSRQVVEAAGHIISTVKNTQQCILPRHQLAFLALYCWRIGSPRIKVSSPLECSDMYLLGDSEFCQVDNK